MKKFLLGFLFILLPAHAQAVVPEGLAETQLVNPFLTGCSVSVMLPAGGHALGTSALGYRCFTSDRMAFGLALQGGYEKVSEKTILGGAVRAEYFLVETGKAFPFLFVQLSGGESKAQRERDKAVVESNAGASAGFGVEVFLMQEISLSAEGGFATNFYPSSTFNATTFSSALALHLHF